MARVRFECYCDKPTCKLCNAGHVTVADTRKPSSTPTECPICQAECVMIPHATEPKEYKCPSCDNGLYLSHKYGLISIHAGGFIND